MVRPVIHSIKHYVQTDIETITASAVNHVVLVSAVKVGDVNSAEEVNEGSVIKAVYVEFWVRAGSATASSGQAIIYKESADTTTPTAAEMAALGSWDNKKNILYTTMGLFNDQDSNAINIYKGWLRIPKGKQRFGLGDTLRISMLATAVDLHWCGFCTYKEYS